MMVTPCENSDKPWKNTSIRIFDSRDADIVEEVCFVVRNIQFLFDF